MEDISVNTTGHVDETLKQHIEDTVVILDPDLFQPKKDAIGTENPELKKEEEEEEINKKTVSISNLDKKEIESFLNIGKPFQFTKTETHSFNEWLNISKFKPIKRELKGVYKTYFKKDTLNYYPVDIFEFSPHIIKKKEWYFEE